MSEPEDRRLKKKPPAQPTRPTTVPGLSRTPDLRPARLLPPIVNEGASTSRGSTSPGPHAYPLKPASERLWTQYHEECMEKSPMYMNWFAIKMHKTDPPGSSKGSRTKLPAPSLKIAGEEEVDLANYLDSNRKFLEAYVAERVPSEEVERWRLLKSKSTFARPPDAKQAMYKPNKPKPPKKELFLSLLNALHRDPSHCQLILEFARSLTNTVGVDAYRVYKLLPDDTSVVHYFYEDYNNPEHEPRMQMAVIGSAVNEMFLVMEVARKKAPLRLSRLEDGKRFPDTPHFLFKASKTKYMKDANHVMYQPVLVSTGETGFIIEMWRIKEKFKVVDEEVSSSFMLWGSLALHYCTLYLEKTRERNLTDFLLHVVKAIFEEMVSLDQLIKTILEFAQHLVNADRASMFLLDESKNELVSTVFDLKLEPGSDKGIQKKEIRVPINSGIAGFVAKSGETMNIPDAYADYRFNREIDAATGYKTVSILCMPIKVEGEVIGVVQMVNKRSEKTFCREDEVAFEIFSTFFGLALKHARLYDRIMRNEQKYKVALDVLSYHSTCRENEVKVLVCEHDHKGSSNVFDLNDYYLDPFKFSEFDKCRSVLVMFEDLFGSSFDRETLSRFVLTVKKNYRDVPYHNFDHGWAVANAMYNILKSDHRKRFNYKTRLAMFVASLCHDLDHRGYTNKYMSETASPLAAMYSTSTLEHHHFNITVTILQQDGHNIFSNMSSKEYRHILGQIRQAILATDLAAFFPNLEKMQKLHDSESSIQFDWAIPRHRELAMAIAMTAADLSAAAKPWDVQLKTVKVIFEEFYDQGDKEYAAGRKPLLMMDRSKRDQQPIVQVGFLSQICIPCYEMLYKILPDTKSMYMMVSKNLIRWKIRADLNPLEPKVERESSHSDGEGEYVSLMQPENVGEVSIAGKSQKSDPSDTLNNMNLESFEDDAMLRHENKVEENLYEKIDSEDSEDPIKTRPHKTLAEKFDDTNL